MNWLDKKTNATFLLAIILISSLGVISGCLCSCHNNESVISDKITCCTIIFELGEQKDKKCSKFNYETSEINFFDDIDNFDYSKTGPSCNHNILDNHQAFFIDNGCWKNLFDNTYSFSITKNNHYFIRKDLFSQKQSLIC